jgi:hypothetical protein
MLKVSQPSAAGDGAGAEATAAVELAINETETTAAAIDLRRRTMTLFSDLEGPYSVLNRSAIVFIACKKQLIATLKRRNNARQCWVN